MELNKLVIVGEGSLVRVCDAGVSNPWSSLGHGTSRLPGTVIPKESFGISRHLSLARGDVLGLLGQKLTTDRHMFAF